MRKLLSGKEIKQLLPELEEPLRTFTKKDKVEMFDEVYKLNDKAFLIKKDDKYFPHLKHIQSLDTSLFKSVSVDKGAIPFMIKGADCMRPGITKVTGPFEKGDFIIIIDENYNKALAIGKTLFNSEDLEAQTGGKVLENIHYVGDSYWNEF